MYDMPGRVRLPKKSLIGRFIFMLCATFLPLGILAFAVSCVVVWISAERSYEAYERELEGVFAPLQESLLGVENDLDRFVLEHITELTSVSDHNEVANYKMIKKLGEIHAAQSMDGVVYLFDRKLASIYTRYNYESYLYSEMKDFQDKLLYRGLSQGTTDGWKLYYFDQKCFLRRSYSYEGYDIGFLVDMNRFMEGLELLQELDAAEIYLSDDTKMILLEDGTSSRFRDGTWEELLARKGAYRLLLWEGEELGCRLAVKIPALTVIQKTLGSLVLLFVILLLEIFFVLLFWRMLKKWVVTPIDRMNEALEFYGKDSQGQYRITGIDESTAIDFRQMFENFNEMAEEIEEGKIKERQYNHMKLDNLKLRMNPHMLMNSFNLIYGMAQVKDYESIQEFALCLVDYFRYILKETNDLVTVKEEMNFVRNYLRIQKIRFPERFNCVYSMTKEVENALIPPLLIENFVENSIKYAMIPKKITEILINIRREGGWLYISVTDTGRGIKPEVMPDIRDGRKYVDTMGNEHIGIYNCRKWMEYYYHGKGQIRITSTFGAGTQVWIEVPFVERKGENHEITDCG